MLKLLKVNVMENHNISLIKHLPQKKILVFKLLFISLILNSNNMIWIKKK